MGFSEVHEEWMKDHLKQRTGERKDRLKRGHSYGEMLFLEKVWWPLVGNFKDLHPEYEVADWRGMKFFVDLMLCLGDTRIAFEIKGYGPHVEQADRTRYRRELNRELFLQAIGVKVISIAVDELEHNADLVKGFVKMIVLPYLSRKEEMMKYHRIEQEIMKLAITSNRVVRPFEVVKMLGISRKTAIKYLTSLCDKEKLKAVEGGVSKRIHKYEFMGSPFLY
ncbi:MAG: hypothetical protein NAG76_09160 [Candidatus Pristimantibacillus lignocellulolyticus]|uniref:DUF559 domain-containing protein n=1 Tax=Candidatus Pristimantibacillus lignocellulolyticus TaxID=2994561 RepID=A0A9J6ZJE4_9BACL|nr:MAG: hypothetical protein NAG76_09160 [Candidatus Pristimantibacillus lignocellulolyticus]